MQDKGILFQRVECLGYMKKIRDGRFIAKDEDENCEYVDTNVQVGNDVWHKPVADEDYDGSKVFLKTYYKRTEKKFSGVVVGIKDIIATAYLVCESQTNWNGNEYVAITREPEDVKKCALVYYGNMRSRFVPLEDVRAIAGQEDQCDGQCFKCWKMDCEKYGKEWEN